MASPMRERISSLTERIRNSEIFPRIRDAEAEMIENEKAFKARRRKKAEMKKRKRKEALEKERAKASNSPDKIILCSPISTKILPSLDRKDLFNRIELNKDPRCSKYMPYDEVFFPKIFDTGSRKDLPDTIHSFWMLGFQDHVTRSNNVKHI